MKANQFQSRAMMLVLLMAVVSLGVVNAQTLTVTGTVTDVADGTPIVGCSVMLKGTTKGTVTNVNGQYAIQAKKKGRRCCFSLSDTNKKAESSNLPDWISG